MVAIGPPTRFPSALCAMYTMYILAAKDNAGGPANFTTCGFYGYYSYYG